MVISGKGRVPDHGRLGQGQFINAKKVPGTDFLCFRMPGTQGTVSFNSDQLRCSRCRATRPRQQIKLAAAIMEPGFQSAFNVVKGSAPARTDVPDTAFDACGKKAIKDLAEANKNNTLVGSMAHGHAMPASIKNAFYDVIHASTSTASSTTRRPPLRSRPPRTTKFSCFPTNSRRVPARAGLAEPAHESQFFAQVTD